MFVLVSVYRTFHRVRAGGSYVEEDLDVLMSGAGYPMVATHDDRLIAITETLAARHGRGRDRYEYQMLYGVRAGRQAALAGDGATVRVYVPFGADWYGYFMRRLAERPANLTFFIRGALNR